MSATNLRTVERAIDAVNTRDIDAYLACCTDDVELRTPVTPVEGAYMGAAGIRRFFSDIEAAGPDFRIEIERTETLGADRVLAFMRTSARGRGSGINMGTETTNVYDFVNGKIRRIEIFLDRELALREAGLTG
jgi:ketosteroid isomerase-like protein